MSVASSLNKFRTRSRVARASGGTITLTAPNLDQQVVPPGARIDGRVEVSNSASFIGIDEDKCNPEGINPGIAGFSTTVEVEVAGDVQYTETKCVGGLGGTQEYTFDIIAPSEPGTYDVSVEAFGANSDNLFEQSDTTLTVESDAPGPDEDDPTCNSIFDAFRTRGCSFSDVLAPGAGSSAAIGAIGVLFAIILIAVLAP